MKYDFHGIELNTGEKRIIEYLLTQKYLKTAYEISKATNKSWYYTIHLLRGLHDRGIVKRDRRGCKIREGVFET